MKSALSNMRVLRHDFKNKLSPLYELAKTGETDELLALLSELTDMCQVTKEYVSSGNSIGIFVATAVVLAILSKEICIA